MLDHRSDLPFVPERTFVVYDVPVATSVASTRIGCASSWSACAGQCRRSWTTGVTVAVAVQVLRGRGSAGLCHGRRTWHPSSPSVPRPALRWSRTVRSPSVRHAPASWLARAPTRPRSASIPPRISARWETAARSPRVIPAPRSGFAGSASTAGRRSTGSDFPVAATAASTRGRQLCSRAGCRRWTRTTRDGGRSAVATGGEPAPA